MPVGSGLVDLSITELPEDTSKPAPEPPSPVIVAAPPQPVPSAPTTKRSGETDAKEGGSNTLVFALIAAVVIAGGAYFALRGSPPPAAPVTPTTPSAPIKAEPLPSAVPAPSAAPRASDPSVVDIGSLGTTPSAAVSAFGPRPDAGAPKDKDDGKDPPAASAAPVASAAPPPPSGSVGDLAEEMRKRVGAKDSPDGPKEDAKETSDAKQSKPSNGAVAGALGAVRGAAKACVEDLGEGVTRVQVVFKSDGTVQSVSVSGIAAGKSAEACVKAAVMKAKVAPFTDATYSASLTIRSN